MNPRDPVAFLKQNFRPLFDAPGNFDRPGAALLITNARKRLRKYLQLKADLAKERRVLQKLVKDIQEALDNADPMRSP